MEELLLKLFAGAKIPGFVQVQGYVDVHPFTQDPPFYGGRPVETGDFSAIAPFYASLPRARSLKPLKESNNNKTITDPNLKQLYRFLYNEGRFRLYWTKQDSPKPGELRLILPISFNADDESCPAQHRGNPLIAKLFLEVHEQMNLGFRLDQETVLTEEPRMDQDLLMKLSFRLIHWFLRSPSCSRLEEEESHALEKFCAFLCHAYQIAGQWSDRLDIVMVRADLALSTYSQHHDNERVADALGMFAAGLQGAGKFEEAAKVWKEAAELFCDDDLARKANAYSNAGGCYIMQAQAHTDAQAEKAYVSALHFALAAVGGVN